MTYIRDIFSKKGSSTSRKSPSSFQIALTKQTVQKAQLYTGCFLQCDSLPGFLLACLWCGSQLATLSIIWYSRMQESRSSSRRKPRRQKHWKEPALFWHVWSQPPLTARHSSTSKQHRNNTDSNTFASREVQSSQGNFNMLNLNKDNTELFVLTS